MSEIYSVTNAKFTREQRLFCVLKTMLISLRKLLGKSTIYVEFALIVLMFLLSFITFKNIFSQTKGGDYFQEVIAALIGTLLTIVITFILLKQQTKTEELKEQNVEVFKKRIERYEEMIKLLVDVREDGKVDEQEAKLLMKSIYSLALVSSEDTIFTLSQYVESIVFEDENESDVGLSDVIACFRGELKLEGIDEFSADLEAVETLLASGFDKTEFTQIKEHLLDAREQISSTLEKRLNPTEFGQYEFDLVARIGRASLFVVISRRTELAYQVILEHDSEESQRLYFRVVGGAIFNEEGNRKQLPKAKIERAENLAISRKFEIDEEDGGWGFFKSYATGNARTRLSNRAVLSKMSTQISQDILALEGFDLEEQNDT